MVKRYQHIGGTVGVIESDAGYYVQHSDYAALQASHARLLDALKVMNEQFGFDVIHPAGMVHDERAAIQKAIDAIAAAQLFAEDVK